LYKLFANEVGLVVSKIFNTSVAKGFVPDAWRHAIVTPVPKSFPVKQNGDLCPISVTSLLCRQLEKLIVRTYMLPILDDPRFFDQYAYKITGSTTGALVDITCKVSLLLESNEFVRCILPYILAYKSIHV